MYQNILTNFCAYPKIQQANFPKDVSKMLDTANSVDPDQTAPQEQSDQDLHCLLKVLLLQYSGRTW